MRSGNPLACLWLLFHLPFPGIAAQQPEPCDLLLHGGTVLDGSGEPSFRADVAVRGGRIVALGELGALPARRRLDAKGLCVAPGFIDAHAHADEDAAKHPEALNFVQMGVTTIVTGNCGTSVSSIGKHFETLERQGISLNYASLIGHGTIRFQVMRRSRAAPSENQLEQMRKRVDEAMRQGAVGMATGLIYVPGTYAQTEELIELCKVVARHGGVYATHMRNESDRLLESVDEALRIGAEAGVHVHLSHLKASGKPHWGKAEDLAQKLTAARAAGVRVTGDQYAYTASSTSLDVLFPTEALEVGRESFAKQLVEDAAFRGQMTAALRTTMQEAGFGDFAYCQIASAPNNQQLNGKTIAQAAAARLQHDDAEAQIRTVIELFAEAKGQRVSMVYHKMCEPDVAAILRLPFVAVASDAGIRVAGDARPHPRGAGNNPRVLGRYSRDLGVIPLPLAVHKMTALPASVFGFQDRGRIRIGACADLVVFDPGTVADRATYAEPLLAPSGIAWVLVNGTVVVDKGEHTGERPGQVLRHRR